MPFDGPDGYVAGLEQVARLFDAPELLTISAWAEKYRWLVNKSSAEPGPWRNARIPYLPAIMDALLPSHPAPLVTICKASQTGGTEVALNWIGWTIHQRPASFLSVWPKDQAAARWSRVKLDGMIATTPELRALIPLGRVKGSINTVREKHYPNGVLYTGSANVPDDVAQISVPNLIADDVDRMPEAIAGEGDPVELGLRRMATFPRGKGLVISTPTLEKSRIWRWWLSSTMGRYFVPCPHCGHMQYLQWEGLKWLAGKPSTAAYVCRAGCGVAIEHRDKTEMLANGEWREQHPDREFVNKGFHIPGLLTPIGLGDTWAQHAAAYERAAGRQSSLQVFFNTRLGEVHKGDRQELEWETLKARAEPFPLRLVPRGVLVLTAGVDVQADRLEAQVVGWGRGESLWTIDKVAFPGDPTRGEVWEELDAFLAGGWQNEFGRELRLSCTLIDAGYLPDHVLSFTRSRKARGIYASRGSTVRTRMAIGLPAYPDVKRKRRKAEQERRGAERYELGVTLIKLWLFEQLRADEGTEEAPVTPAERHVHFSAELPDEYFRQVCAETYDPREGWIARANYHRNEDLDTLVMCRAAALHHRVAVHRWKEADWSRLALLYESPVAIDPPPIKAKPLELPGGRMLPTAAVKKEG